MKQKAAHGHAKKHTGTKKHAAHTAKHHPASQHAHHQPAKAHHPKTAHVKAKHPAHTKARGLTLGDVQCCAAEALAWSLRLSGWPVADADVLALYKLTADSPDAGASILATLDAAYLFGLAGVRPVSFRPVEVHEADAVQRWPVAGLGADHAGELDAFHLGQFDLLDDIAVALLDDDPPVPAGPVDGDSGDIGRGDSPLVFVHPLILGVDLPGPHTVLQQDGQWWTWGEPYDPCCFPDAVVEEAWAVTWP